MPRHTRACNVVAFCPTDPTLLAAGLDKVRNDFGLIVWDTEMAARGSSVGPNSAVVHTESAGDVSGVGGMAVPTTEVSKSGQLPLHSVLDIETALGKYVDLGGESVMDTYDICPWLISIDSRKTLLSNVSDPPTKTLSIAQRYHLQWECKLAQERSRNSLILAIHRRQINPLRNTVHRKEFLQPLGFSTLLLSWLLEWDSNGSADLI